MKKNSIWCLKYKHWDKYDFNDNLKKWGYTFGFIINQDSSSVLLEDLDGNRKWFNLEVVEKVTLRDKFTIYLRLLLKT